MWVRRSAIGPIPLYARVNGRSVQQAAERLSQAPTGGHEDSQKNARERLGRAHPALSRFLGLDSGRGQDSEDLALGWAVTIFCMFEGQFGPDLLSLSEDALRACEGEIRADEELRLADGTDPMDTDDILATEQPHVMAWLNEAVSELLERRAESIDVDEVGRAFSLQLIVVLALSRAVKPPRGLGPLSSPASA